MIMPPVTQIQFDCPSSRSSSRSDHPWIRIQVAVYVLRYFFKSANIPCVCEHQMNPLSIHIHYIDRSQTELGVDEQVLDDWCLKRLSFASISLPDKSPFYSEWMESLREIRSHVFNRVKIGLTVENGRILLFGAPNLVQLYQQRFQPLQQNDVDHPVVSTMVKSVPQFVVNFTIDRPGFESLLLNEPWRLTAVLPWNCSFTKQILTANIPIEVPMSHTPQVKKEIMTTIVDDTKPSPPVNNRRWWQKMWGRKLDTTPPSSPAPLRHQTSIRPPTSLEVDQARISVCQGDLRTQQVKRIVSLFYTLKSFRSMRLSLLRRQDTCARPSPQPWELLH